MCSDCSDKPKAGPLEVYQASAASKMDIPLEDALLITKGGWLNEHEKHIYWRAQRIVAAHSRALFQKYYAQCLRAEADRIEQGETAAQDRHP